MNIDVVFHGRRALIWPALSLFCLLFVLRADANPTGGTVSQGAATFSSSGSTFNINQSSANAFINWQSFNIGLGETVNFNQPSASSVTFNQINQGNASQILGNLNANGYVVLENASGFYIGGQAVLTAHGLILTTATTPALNLGAGGPWSFDAPPPAAKIQNFGQIKITGGGTAYLIAADIVNGGTIDAPNGHIGLYDGETVLVSSSPNGEGISAAVTLPQGSVDNEGNLTADGGSVVAQAQFVNQNGIVQANSAENINGTIELIGGSSVALGAKSVISAQGDGQGVSSGGSVNIQAGNTFSDQAGSMIDVAGGAQGGNGGQVNICAPHMGAINSVIDGRAQNGFTGGILTIDPYDIWLDTSDNAPQGSDYTFIDINNYSGVSQINIQADDDIVLNTIWNLTVPATLSLTAGNDITLNSGSAINAALSEIPTDISLQAGNEIMLASGSGIQANGGSVALTAPTVDLAGTLQANSVRSASGLIDVNAAQSLTLEASSSILANGDPNATTTPSPGGFVVLNAGNNYSDALGSTISVSGTAGGPGGIVEVLDPQAGFTPIESAVSGYLAYLINPYDITLSDSTTGTSQDANNNLDANFNVNDLAAYSQIDLLALDDITLNTTWNLSAHAAPASLILNGENGITINDNSGISAGKNWTVSLTSGSGGLNLGASCTISADNLNLAIPSISSTDGNAIFQAIDNIELDSSLTLSATLNLIAGNDITLESGSSISAGNNWNVNLTAGAGFVPTAAQPLPASGSDGIYLDGTSTSGSYIQSQSGSINLVALNEVQVGWSAVNGYAGAGVVNAGLSSIVTEAGGSINVRTAFGDVNTGSNPNGYSYYSSNPYERPSVALGGLGGISTAAGGNVMISAGGDVISFAPSSSTPTGAQDPGTGAFGIGHPGNVVITAGGNIYGHFMLADGIGQITSLRGNVGANTGNPFALSLTSGGWTVDAPDGSIYLQEVRNPNGDFNYQTSKLGVSPNYLITYSPQDYVNLIADGVYLTGLGYFRTTVAPVTVLYPSILDIEAGSGGLTLENNVTLFPSVDQNLEITTLDGGNFVAVASPSGAPYLFMSDSASPRWVTATVGDPGSFTLGEPGALANEPNDSSPVSIFVSGSMENLNLITTKVTDINVIGDMINCGFFGQNLEASDVTSITVDGQIYYTSPYSFFNLSEAIPNIPANDLLPGMNESWDDIFTLAINADALANYDTKNLPTSVSQWLTALLTDPSITLFGNTANNNGVVTGLNPGFFYNPTSLQLGYAGSMGGNVLSDLGGGITILHLVNGQPVIGANGQFETDTISWAPASAVQTLFTESQGRPSIGGTPQYGLEIGGPGAFDITAGSIELGSSYGIISGGVADGEGVGRYGDLTAVTPVGGGASININVTALEQPTDPNQPLGEGNPLATSLDMLASTIAALGGGSVNVNDSGGSINLGIAGLPTVSPPFAYGIYTSGGGNASVTALGNVNIDGSRIATFNGGNIFVESQTEDVNVGNGSSDLNAINAYFTLPGSGHAADYSEDVFGSGILAYTLVPPASKGANLTLPPNPATAPGNITVETPQGSIVTSSAGILQEALDGSVSPGPYVTLTAGTFPSGASPGYVGNIYLGNSGVIGGTVNLSANGNITGQIVSRQNSTVNAAQSFSGTLLSAGSADVSGASVSGTIIGVGGANVSGASVTASVLGQNVSVNGGANQSTLGSSATATASTQSAAQTASSQSQQQVAADTSNQDDDKKKKKTQIRKVGHVTVILASAK